MKLRLALWGLFFVSLFANYWLWGHWNFATQAPWLSGLLGVSALSLVGLLVHGMVSGLRQKAIRNLSKSWVFRSLYLLFVLSSLVLTLVSFWWLRTYLLPFQIVFFLVNGYLFIKKKGWFIGNEKDKLSK